MTNLCLVLAGAPLHNDNRGVEALGRSVVDIIEQKSPGAQVSVLDGGWGVRADDSGAYTRAGVEYVGVRRSRRWHRQESWTRVRLDQALGNRRTAVGVRLARADAVLDLSGGDSFTDLYGRVRLQTVAAPKEATLRAGRPLVLLPQTYGPFTTRDGRGRAERLVRRATVAYSRDAWSHAQLLALAGRDADESRLREGVDVAFSLRPRAPGPRTTDKILGLSAEMVVGVNVSGLLRNQAGHARFGLAGDYLVTMAMLVRSLISSGAMVVFVPHVHGRGGLETDVAAIEHVRDSLTPAQRSRTWVVPSDLRAAELKWCIARTDWFVGSRMHATIAALSSGVPAVGYAYSDKTRGVFATCGLAGHVVDARSLTGEAAVSAVMESFTSREGTRADLSRRVPAIVRRARSQLVDVLHEVGTWAEAPESIGAIV